MEVLISISVTYGIDRNDSRVKNGLILTESALEDFKIFKNVYGKRINIFFISLPICCFQKAAALGRLPLSHNKRYGKSQLHPAASCLTDLNGHVEGLH